MTFTLSIVANRWCMGEGEVCYLALSVALINEWEVTETISFILPLLRKVFPLIFFFTCWHIWSGYPKAHPGPAEPPPTPVEFFVRFAFVKHDCICLQYVYLILYFHYKNPGSVWRGIKTSLNPQKSAAPGTRPRFWNSWNRHCYLPLSLFTLPVPGKGSYVPANTHPKFNRQNEFGNYI